jgi:3-deoxy-D-manno-octulosonic-acid transferase
VFLLIDKIVILLLALAIRISSLWNRKARLWLRGRKDIIRRVTEALAGNERPVLWMHSSSLGEFEQGRILLETLRARYPSYLVVVTFFSPSGYEVRKDYKGADHVFYLPLPLRKNARRFIQALNPSLVLWIKYDYWYNYLHELKKRSTPVLLVSAIFLRNNSFFKWYGQVYKKMLDLFTWLFVQDEASERRLKVIGVRNASVSGDTRFDRVTDIAENFRPMPEIEALSRAIP